MRILHVGSGFRPWRLGGLVAYVEDLLSEQVRRGHEPAYLFSGRQYPFLRGPRLKRWQRPGIEMLEVVNSPLYDHGRQPELEVAQPRLERMLERVLAETRPEVVHVHELAGLPFSALDVIHASGTPAVVTLQDYFPLCSTFKLLDSEGKVCLRREIGADCVATTASDPRDAGILIEATLMHHVTRNPRTRGLQRPALPLSREIARVAVAHRRRREPASPLSPAAFQRRRKLNVERLNRADRVVAMSSRVAEIYKQLGVDPARLITMQLTLAHIERLTPRRPRRDAPLTFATLAGFESVPKGALVLREALSRLTDAATEGRFRLLVFGTVDRRFEHEAARLPGVEVRGRYAPSQLDAMLDEVDVGILPSVWEEAYGYAGMELLAKGIPVIANAIGGMTDYTRDGETGWLNRSCSGEELARIMRGAIDHPEQVAELNQRLLANRDSIVKPLARHAEEMDSLYAETIAARARTPQPSPG
ncbi:MAG: glycosyltransferase [Gaiellaceae bacterium]